MKKITICDYLARAVPQECFEVLENSAYDFPRPKNTAELAESLKKFISLERESGLKQLAEIHPDKKLLQSLDREVRENDYEYQPNMEKNMFSHGYNNPFWKTPYRVGAPNAVMPMGFDGYTKCGICGGHSYMPYAMNFMHHDGGGCGCGCGGNCGDKMNATGQGRKDYTPLFVAVGIFALAIYFAEVNRKS